MVIVVGDVVVEGICEGIMDNDSLEEAPPPPPPPPLGKSTNLKGKLLYLESGALGFVVGVNGGVKRPPDPEFGFICEQRCDGGVGGAN